MQKKNIFGLRAMAIMLVLGLFLCPALFAEEYISANDLEAATIKTTVTIDGFSIFATAEKAVNVEAIDEPRTAQDGEIFNARIKLNGSGKAEYRSVHFTTQGKAALTIYTNSSSKTDARILLLCAVDGTVIGELTAPADSGIAGMATATIPAAGEYVVYSKSSGINIYQIVVK